MASIRLATRLTPFPGAASRRCFAWKPTYECYHWVRVDRIAATFAFRKIGLRAATCSTPSLDQGIATTVDFLAGFG
jgi:hypothetical protein